MAENRRTTPNSETRDAERAEAEARSGPDRMPTSEEEQRAEEHEVSNKVAEHEEEMLKRGADQQGEGRLP